MRWHSRRRRRGAAGQCQRCPSRQVVNAAAPLSASIHRASFMTTGTRAVRACASRGAYAQRHAAAPRRRDQAPSRSGTDGGAAAVPAGSIPRQPHRRRAALRLAGSCTLRRGTALVDRRSQSRGEQSPSSGARPAATRHAAGVPHGIGRGGQPQRQAAPTGRGAASPASAIWPSSSCTASTTTLSSFSVTAAVPVRRSCGCTLAAGGCHLVSLPQHRHAAALAARCQGAGGGPCARAQPLLRRVGVAQEHVVCVVQPRRVRDAKHRKVALAAPQRAARARVERCEAGPTGRRRRRSSMCRQRAAAGQGRDPLEYADECACAASTRACSGTAAPLDTVSTLHVTSSSCGSGAVAARQRTQSMRESASK